MFLLSIICVLCCQLAPRYSLVNCQCVTGFIRRSMQGIVSQYIWVILVMIYMLPQTIYCYITSIGFAAFNMVQWSSSGVSRWFRAYKQPWTYCLLVHAVDGHLLCCWWDCKVTDLHSTIASALHCRPLHLHLSSVAAPCGLRELWFFVRIGPICFLAGCRKRRLNQG